MFKEAVICAFAIKGRQLVILLQQRYMLAIGVSSNASEVCGRISYTNTTRFFKVQESDRGKEGGRVNANN